MKKLILSSFAIAALVFVSNSVSANELSAQSDTVLTKTSTLGVSIATVMELNVTSGNALTLGFTTAADLTGGKETVADAVTLNYKSNKESYITIKADDFVSAGNSSLIMPASIIEFKKTGGSYASMSNSEQELSGAAGVGNGNVKGAADIKLTYKVTPGLTYDPATDYSTTITYTITAH